MAKSSSSSKNKVKKEKESLDNKLAGFESASKDLDNLLGSQRSDKNKEGLGYNDVPPPPHAQVYLPLKKDLSWTGLPEFVDDTVTEYSRPTPSIDASKCNKSELKSSKIYVSEHGESSGSIMSKPMIRVVTKGIFSNGLHWDSVFWSTARIETTNQETKILATVDGKPRTISESSLRMHLKINDEEGISSLPDAKLFENLSLMGYNILPNQRFTFQKGQFSHQWKFLIQPIMQCLSPKSTGFNEFSSNIATAVVCLATNRVYNFSKMIFDGMVRNINSKGTKFLMYPSLDAKQDREKFAKTSALPHESSPRVTSLDADKGSMQQRIHELMELCTSLQRQQSQMAAKIKDQDLETSSLKARVKSLQDKERRNKSTELGSNDTKEMVNVLSSMEASNILTSRGATASVSPADVLPTVGVPTFSGSFLTISAIFTTTSVVKPYTRRPGGITIGSSQPMRSPIIGSKDKGKEKVVESERLSEQLARDYEIARLHAEEELKMIIEGLDRSNEVIAKHLREYEQAAANLSVKEKLELISELVKYQDHRAKILKYQAHQSKPLSKKEQREFYMSVLRSHAGWKTKHFRGMTLEQIKEKFIPVWKQLEDFVPMSSKEESERVKRQGIKIDQMSLKRVKTSKSVYKDVSEEELKGMMQLVPLEEVYVEALQQLDREDLHQLWTLVKETFSIKHSTKDKDKELWVKLKRLFEPNFEDHLWTHNQAFMHDPLDWKLYDTCGVHHVSTKDQEIFMLVEMDYPLRKGLTTVMISNKLQVEQYSQMDNDLILKIHNIANSPR
nr:hypothetical protein [Tanacetum cinerariifolium]